MICECLVEINALGMEKTFTYNIPNNLIDKIKVGMRVKVPFGKQVLEGFVLSIHKDDKKMELKDVYDLIDDYPILNDELLHLGHYMEEMTISPLIKCYQAMLPLALKAKHKVNLNRKVETFIKLNTKFEDNIKFNDSQMKIISYLKEHKEEKISVLNKISSSSVKTLLNKNVLISYDKEIYRYQLDDLSKSSYKLSDKQQEICDYVLNNDPTTYLIHGVTGSGKTNVYMEIIDGVIKRGKKAIMLVPEISLTPQIIERFTRRFDKIAVLHSGLSNGEKYDEWRKIKEGKVDIVIGARSAVFAPFDDIGVIIIDEEHSNTYKQDNVPRYHAIDIAKERCRYHNAPLILGSATPSLESYARARKGVYKLLELKDRYNNHPLPKIEIIDMNKEFKKANGYFSNQLLDELQKTIDRGEQAILLLNRRGYSSSVICKSCGYVEKCPNCDISLTYHKSSNMLRCHYCGYATVKKEKCPNCGEEFNQYGLGTEKAFEELNEKLNNARIVRMDVDTTSTKNAHKKIINDFGDGKYNILLGTQMIAKGLDFPNCTLVGVINADLSLNFPDFRASETTFSLLNQVGGRSGRGSKPGKVLIQTFNPDHYAIRYIKNNDYIGFYNSEMLIRRKLGYPPYYYLCLIRVVSKDYNLASEVSIKISKYLRSIIKNNIILGPSVANQFKLNNNYRFQIIIKYKDFNTIKDILNKIYVHYFDNRDVKIEIDINPMKL